MMFVIIRNILFDINYSPQFSQIVHKHVHVFKLSYILFSVRHLTHFRAVFTI